VEFVMDKAKRLTVFPNSKASRVSNWSRIWTKWKK
jgi:hypothetical protein